MNIPFKATIGVDEVGRGSLFGPVSVGAVLVAAYDSESLAKIPWAASVKDSKLVSRKKRLELAPLIESHFLSTVSHVAVRYIDTHNINRAVQYGIYRSVQALLKLSYLSLHEVLVLCDGNYRFTYPTLGMAKPMPKIRFEVKADQKYFPVSAASIIAKVQRDSLIEKTSLRFPEYALSSSAGYGTLAHRQAIKAHGPTRFHRRSFGCRLD